MEIPIGETGELVEVSDDVTCQTKGHMYDDGVRSRSVFVRSKCPVCDTNNYTGNITASFDHAFVLMERCFFCGSHYCAPVRSIDLGKRETLDDLRSNRPHLPP